MCGLNWSADWYPKAYDVVTRTFWIGGDVLYYSPLYYVFVKNICSRYHDRKEAIDVYTS